MLTDHNLASLGDAYINFVYSLVISNQKGEPAGVKVKGSILANALKKAGLREILPARMTHHMMADAAEALIVYAWLNNHVTLEESVAILEKASSPCDGFSRLLAIIRNRAKFS